MVRPIKDPLKINDEKDIKESLENRLAVELEERFELGSCASGYCGGYHGPVSF